VGELPRYYKYVISIMSDLYKDEEIMRITKPELTGILQVASEYKMSDLHEDEEIMRITKPGLIGILQVASEYKMSDLYENNGTMSKSDKNTI
jgi:hypothetical protein